MSNTLSDNIDHYAATATRMIADRDAIIAQLTADKAELLEGLSFYADQANFMYMEKHGLLEFAERNMHLQSTAQIGTKARTLITKHSKGGWGV